MNRMDISGEGQTFMIRSGWIGSYAQSVRANIADASLIGLAGIEICAAPSLHSLNIERSK